MERWLFLDNEPKEKVEQFARGLEQTWGNFFDFSAGSPRSRINDFSLEKFFQEVGELINPRVAFGQKLLGDEQIRFFARNKEVTCNYIFPQTNQNYRIASEIFKESFGVNVEDYPSQSRIE